MLFLSLKVTIFLISFGDVFLKYWGLSNASMVMTWLGLGLTNVLIETLFLSDSTSKYGLGFNSIFALFCHSHGDPPLRHGIPWSSRVASTREY